MSLLRSKLRWDFDRNECEDEEVSKNIFEFSDEDEEDEKEGHKDNKTINILFDGIDVDVIDDVINCTTAKEVLDNIQTQVQNKWVKTKYSYVCSTIWAFSFQD